MDKKNLRQLEFLFEHLDLACLALEDIAEEMFEGMSEEEKSRERVEGEPASEHDLITFVGEKLGNEVLGALKELLERNGYKAIRTGIDD